MRPPQCSIAKQVFFIKMVFIFIISIPMVRQTFLEMQNFFTF